MSRRSNPGHPESLRLRLIDRLSCLSEHIQIGSIADQVCALVEISRLLKDLGASIGSSLSVDSGRSGRRRLEAYFRHQVGKIVHTDELMIVSGIGDYPRRIRELRTDHGWPIISGLAMRDMVADSAKQATVSMFELSKMAPEEYVLIEDLRDPDAIRRWADAERIKAANPNQKSAIEAYFRSSPGRRITAEEVRNVAGDSTQWPALIRQLIDEGFIVRQRATPGGEDLPSGIFIYEHGGKDDPEVSDD